jgi:F1F0 ATPase subunit 2
MVMTNVFVLLGAGFAGMLIGGVFFGGLWLTVRKCLTTSHPASWLLASALIRMFVALVGIYFVGAGQWPRMLACLVGFIVARQLVIHITRSPIALPPGGKQQANHAA